jgi:hypothetical protein
MNEADLRLVRCFTRYAHQGYERSHPATASLDRWAPDGYRSNHPQCLWLLTPELSAPHLTPFRSVSAGTRARYFPALSGRKPL